jgi:hypothetical protein
MGTAGGATRGHPRDGQRRPDKLRWNNADGVYFMPFASNRQTVEAFRDLVKGIGDSARKQRQTPLFVSIMPHFGVHYFRCPTNPWGVGRASGVV